MASVPDAPPEWSAWERELWATLTGHIEAERELLDEYVDVAKSTGSAALSYLVNLLIEDEMRHHKLFTELAGSLKTLADFGPGDPQVPYLDFDSVDSREVLSSTRKLIAHEEADARELERLRRDVRDLADTTLWDVLVDLMCRDTQKHLAILRFVERHAGHR